MKNKKYLLWQLLPFIFILLSLFATGFFYRQHLQASSKQFNDDFTRQNMRELSIQDSFALITRLNNISGALNWVCIEAVNSGTPFYTQKKGDCEEHFWQSKTRILSSSEQYYIDLTLRLPATLEILIIFFTFIQLSLLIFFVVLIKALMKSRIEGAKKLEELAYRVAHDLRSPLVVIDDAIANQNMSLIQSANIRIKEIANDLLKERKTEKITQDLGVIISEIRAEKIIEHKNKSPEIIVDVLQSFVPPIPASEFKRILSNLINNALEATPHPKIKIYSEIKNDHFLLFIQDNGPGIPKNILNSLGKKQITSKESGNGLGLYSALKIMKEHKGDLAVKSEDGVGTTIELLLPYKTRSCVLVDDDALVRLTWETRAKKAGITLKTYPSVNDLLKVANHIEKDTIIYLDYEIKGSNLSGLELVEKLHKLGFKELYLTTGHNPKLIPNKSFIKGVLGKKPAF